LENYFGVPGKKDGKEVLEIGLEQARGFGAEHLPLDVLKVEITQEDLFQVELENNQSVSARTVVFATGVTRRKAKIKGEKEFLGKGVSYCVDCDGFFFRGLPVVVIGDGSAAVHGALTLTKITSPVYLVTKGLNVTDELQKELEESEVIVMEGKPVEILGKDEVEALVLEDGRKIEVKGVFIEQGAKGALQLATTLGVMLDPENMTYIQVDRKQQTNLPGVFAAGDVCGPPFQVAKAVGEGCVAGLSAAEEASRRKKR
jgi:thioredoxin reductase (NADPH)